MEKVTGNAVRLALAILETEFRELQEQAEESSRDVPSEAKTHVAAAFAYELARKRVKRLDMAARRSGFKK